jgi:hypothetical protein
MMIELGSASSSNASAPPWARRMRTERQARGWSQRDAVRILQAHSPEPLPAEDSLLRQWKRWESGDVRPEDLYASLIARADLVPPQVMLGQLDRLLGLVGAPNIRLAIAEARRLPVPPLTGFLLLDTDLAIVETFASSVRIQGEEVAVYDRIMQLLLHSAATDDQARRLILEATARHQL